MPIRGSAQGPHLIKPGGCSYFILIPAIHRLRDKTLALVLTIYHEGHEGRTKGRKVERLFATFVHPSCPSW